VNGITGSANLVLFSTASESDDADGCADQEPLMSMQPTLASAVVGRNFSFSLHCRAPFALGAFGQVLGSALLRNTITPPVADQNS
jgi:hypothetical protein